MLDSLKHGKNQLKINLKVFSTVVGENCLLSFV